MQSVDRPVALSRLRITNIRGLKEFELEFVSPDDGTGQWTLVLGDNGVGKSTILRSIVLASAGASTAGALLATRRTIAPYIRHGESIGEIELHLSDGDVTKATISATVGDEHIKTSLEGSLSLFAYGAQRGSATEGETSFRPLSAVATLFDDQATMMAGQSWLQRRRLGALTSQSEGPSIVYDAVIETLKGLLPGVERIDVLDDAVWLEGPDIGRAPLGALSDGYLTTTGWVIDMIARWAEMNTQRGAELAPGFNEAMTGLVLIDEIDLHLHPKWQTEVVRNLRTIFPKMSFIATTHNPLTLLGAEKGEIHALRRTVGPGQIVARQIDIPPGTTAERVLTGEWFGLSSTLDPETLAMLDSHRTLLREGVQPDDPRRQRLESELRDRLGQFGDTSIERIAQDVAAEVMHEDFREISPEERSAIRDEIKKRVRQESS